MVATLEGADKLVKAASEAGNPLTTIEILPDGTAAISFLRGLEEAYRQEAVAGVGNPTVAQLEKNFAANSALKSDGNIEIGVAAAGQVKDTVDIHIEHQETAGGGLKADVPLQKIQEMAQAFEQGYQEATTPTPTPSNLQLPAQPQTLIDEPIITVYQNEQQQPIMQVRFDENNVDLRKLQAQLQELADSQQLGEQGTALVANTMQQIITKYPQLAEQLNEKSAVPASQVPASHYDAGERGQEVRRIVGYAQTDVSPISPQIAPQTSLQTGDLAFQGVAASVQPEVGASNAVMSR